MVRHSWANRRWESQDGAVTLACLICHRNQMLSKELRGMIGGSRRYWMFLGDRNLFRKSYDADTRNIHKF